MEIKEAYKRQQNLEHRIQDAQCNASLADTEDQRNELWVVVADLERELAQVQSEFGGHISRIPEENIPALQKRIKRYIRQAEKNGAPTPNFEVIGEPYEEVRKVNGVTHVFTYRFVVAGGDPPTLSGWTFVATLDHSLDQTVIRTAPGQEIDLSDYRDADPICDHCNKIRSRKDTYIVKHEDGTIKQVGRTCLQDFISTLTPARVVSYFDFIRELREGSFEKGSGERAFGAHEYLTHAACSIRTHGWVSSSQSYDYGDLPTKNAALDNLLNQREQKKDRQGHPLWIDPTEEDERLAEAALVTARQIDPQTDFDHNLKTVASANYWTHRHLGIAAYIVQHHKREVEKEVKKRIQEERVNASNNEHFGEIKDRIELALTVTAIHEIANRFSYEGGVTYITAFEDSEGRKFKWFGSYSLEIGSSYEGRWTIKGHDEFKGIKETVLTRPHSLAIVETV